MHCSSLINKTVFFAVLLNIVLSTIAVQYASKDEVKPSNGVTNLSFKSQIMHMLVHHQQVLFSSSILIGILVYLSMYISYSIRKS